MHLNRFIRVHQQLLSGATVDMIFNSTAVGRFLYAIFTAAERKCGTAKSLCQDCLADIVDTMALFGQPTPWIVDWRSNTNKLYIHRDVL